MKNTLRILAVLLAVITLTLVAFAADGDSGKWKQIYTASDLVAAYKNGSLVPKNLSISETYDDTGYYLRSKAETKNAAALCFTLPTAVDPSKVNAVIIGYRTNYLSQKGEAANATGMDFPKDNTFNWQSRYVSGYYERTDMQSDGTHVQGVIVFDNLQEKIVESGATTFKYFKFTPWNGQSLIVEDDSQLNQVYADVEFVGFFESSEEASNFNYDEYSKGMLDLTVYTVTYLDRDGKKITEEKTLMGSTYSTISAPVIKYYDFIGWYVTYQGNEMKVPTKFEVPFDITLQAKYSYNEAAYLSDYRKEIIAEAQKKGLERTDKPFIAGYDGFEFRPDNNMTRAEACTVITRLLVDENTLDNSKATAFTDLNKNAWYYKYVTYLESIGYLKSYSGEFKPDQKITRAEFVELVYQMGKISGGDKVVSFKDVPADHPRYDVIMAAAKAGLVNGKSADTFDPDGDIKRSEVVKVLCIALGRVPNSHSFDDVVVAGLSDITDKHWAYPYVIEAAFEHTAVEDKNGEEIWLTVNDTNDYYSPVPDGLIDKLNATFDKRVEEIRNTKSEWTVAEGGTVWYFSSSEGENMNDGKSPETPMKTLAKLERMQNEGKIKPGDVVLLKRGDEWHDQLICVSGITYSAYGEGDKPKIVPSVEADDPSDWKETDIPGVYTFKWTLLNKLDVANIVFNDGECYAQRVVMDPADNTKTLTAGSDFIVGNGINTWYQPIREFHGYATLAEIASETSVADLMFYYDRETGDLYLYSRTGNPGERFEAIDICTHGHGVNIQKGAGIVTENVTIDNLCVLYAGSHGIGASSTKNLTVRNCEVGWIGGAHQSPKDLTSQTRYGNAIEVYGTADGFYVYNNYVHDCFDCGPTIQWSGDLMPGEVKIAKDIEIYSNVVWEGSLEVWFSVTTVPTDDTYAVLENCRLYDNLVTGSGHGWKAYNHYKFEWTSFYGGGGTNAYYNDCYIENNYFWGIKRHLMKAVPTTTVNGNGFTWRNNVIIHPDGEGSIGYMGADAANGKGKKTQYFYDKDTINTLVKNGALGLNKFYYTPGDIANRRNIIQF